MTLPTLKCHMSGHWLPHDEFAKSDGKDKPTTGADGERDAKRPKTEFDLRTMDAKTLRGLGDTVLSEITRYLTDIELTDLCRTRSELNDVLCRNDLFWMRRMQQRVDLFTSSPASLNIDFTTFAIKEEITATRDFPWGVYYKILSMPSALELTALLLVQHRFLRKRYKSNIYQQLLREVARAGGEQDESEEQQEAEESFLDAVTDEVPLLTSEAWDAVNTPNFIVDALFGPHKTLFQAKMFTLAMQYNPGLAIHINKRHNILHLASTFLRGPTFLFGQDGFANLAGATVLSESRELLRYLIPLLGGRYWYEYAIRFAYHEGDYEFAADISKFYGEYQYDRGFAAGVLVTGRLETRGAFESPSPSGPSDDLHREIYTSPDGRTHIAHNEFAKRDVGEPLGVIPWEIHADETQWITCYEGQLRVKVADTESIVYAKSVPAIVPKGVAHQVEQSGRGKVDFISVYLK